jgi:hypothetical protein
MGGSPPAVGWQRLADLVVADLVALAVVADLVVAALVALDLDALAALVAIAHVAVVVDLVVAALVVVVAALVAAPLDLDALPSWSPSSWWSPATGERVSATGRRPAVVPGAGHARPAPAGARLQLVGGRRWSARDRRVRSAGMCGTVVLHGSGLLPRASRRRWRKCHPLRAT